MSEIDRVTGLVGFSGMKVPVRAASTAALTLSGEQTVDGVALVTDDRVLVKNQASSIDNGIYVVDTGDWSRAPDCDGSYDLRDGSLIFVTDGSTQASTIFETSGTNPIDIGTDAITFTANSLIGPSTVTTAMIQNQAVTFVKMQNIATDRLIGRDTASSGSPEEISVGGGLEFTGSAGIQVATAGVTLAKMADIATDRLIGRDTAATGVPEALTVGGGIEFTGSGGIQTSALTGDVTKAAGGTVTTIGNDAVTYAKMQNVSATDRLLGRSTSGAGDVEEITCTAAGRALLDDAAASDQRTTLGLVIGTNVAAMTGVNAARESMVFACSDETSALTAGTNKITFRMPYAFTLTAVRASVTIAPTGATLLTVDINESGTTILSTKLTFDASEKTTTTATTPPVISDASLADDAEMTIDIDSIGNTIAGSGLKVYLIGYKT